VKYRPDYPSQPFTSTDQACTWVEAFVGWYNDRHRHSGIRFVTPFQRHSGEAVAISRHRAQVYEQARHAIRAIGVATFASGVNRRWSGSIRRHPKTAPMQLRR